MVFSDLRWGLAAVRGGRGGSFARLQISHMGQSVRSPLVRRRAGEKEGNNTGLTSGWTRRRYGEVNRADSVFKNKQTGHLCIRIMLGNE